MIKLSELLKLRGFQCEPTRTKLIRHRDSRLDLSVVYHQGWLETYQSFQASPIFDGCDTIISFIGEEAGRDRFFGAFSVRGSVAGAEAIAAALPANCPYTNWPSEASRHYRLERISGLEDYEGRLLIDWGPAQRAWHQWYRDGKTSGLREKEVVEISSRGRSLSPFRDYLRFSLTHRELQELVRHQEAHLDWRAALSAVGAVYLVVATDTGKQYVGSATGLEGLWQRWTEYEKTGHGNNVVLRQLMEEHSAYPQAFSYSVLHTFSKTLTRGEALELESEFKRKLGSRATGLNGN